MPAQGGTMACGKAVCSNETIRCVYVSIYTNVIIYMNVMCCRNIIRRNGYITIQLIRTNYDSISLAQSHFSSSEYDGGIRTCTWSRVANNIHGIISRVYAERVIGVASIICKPQ